MTPEATLAAIVLVPVVLLIVFRINATLVFLSLCLGNILVQFVAPDANSFLQLFSAHVPKNLDTGNDTVKLILLLLPALLTSVFMIRTVNGKARMLLNVVPALGVGLLGALLVVPLLPPGLSHDIVHSSLWHQMQQAQNLIVGTTALACLLVLWLQRPQTGSKHGKKHKS